MSEDICAQNKEKIKLVPVKNAPHGLSYIVDTDAYKAAFVEFIEKTRN